MESQDQSQSETQTAEDKVLSSHPQECWAGFVGHTLDIICLLPQHAAAASLLDVQILLTWAFAQPLPISHLLYTYCVLLLMVMMVPLLMDTRVLNRDHVPY